MFRKVFHLLFSFTLFAPLAFAQNTLTLTTYYPAPFGAYSQVRLVPQPTLPSPCDPGTMYVNDTDNRLYLCRDEGGTGVWDAGSIVWMQETNNIFLTDTDPATFVGIGTNTPEFKLTLDQDGGFMARGTFGSGATLTTAGAGARMFWYPRKAAFRAGLVSAGQWNDAFVGNGSVAFGADNVAWSLGSSILGGSTNVIQGASTREAVIAGGNQNQINDGSVNGAIGGGWNNQLTGDYSVISGGTGNIITSANTSIGGGIGNQASGLSSTVSGGQGNTASGALSTVAGGMTNTASGNTSFAGGGMSNTPSGQSAATAGGENNTASGVTAATLGGDGNTASGESSAVLGSNWSSAGGRFTVILGCDNCGVSNVGTERSTVLGGFRNNVSGGGSSIIGGFDSQINSASDSIIAGGNNHTISAGSSAIIAGSGSTISGGGSVILGGNTNTASGNDSVVMGTNNSTQANNSFVGGSNIELTNVSNGTFVWGNPGAVTQIATASAFIILTGNVGIGNDDPPYKLTVDGVIGGDLDGPGGGGYGQLMVTYSGGNYYATYAP